MEAMLEKRCGGKVKRESSGSAAVEQQRETEAVAGLRLFIDGGEVGSERLLTAANGVRIGFSTL